MVDSAKQLILVRRGLAESTGGNVDENWLAGASESFSGCLPSHSLPAVGLAVRPAGQPITHALLACLVLAGADQVVANVDVELRGRTCNFLDPDNLEFSRLHSRHRGKIIFKFVEKLLAARHQFAGETAAQNLDAISGTRRDFSSRKQRSSFNRRVEEFRQAGQRGCGSPERPAPFAEKLHDFKRVLFGDVLVRAGNNFQQNVIQRRLHGVVRSQANIREGERMIAGYFGAQQPEGRRVEWRGKKEHRRPPDSS